jgi:hypothetical protein
MDANRGTAQRRLLIGVPASEDARAAEVLAPPRPISSEPTRLERLAQNPTSMAARAFFNSPAAADVINTRASRAAEIPSSNGHTTARGIDAILEIPSRFGLGSCCHYGNTSLRWVSVFNRSAPAHGPSGIGGWAALVGFADPDGRVGFGYVMNQYRSGTPEHPDLRWPSLVEAIYASLGRQRV